MAPDDDHSSDEPTGGAGGDEERLPAATAVSEAPRAVQMVSRLDEWLGRIETAALVLFMTVLVGVGVYQSAASHLFNKNDTWPYEVLRYSVFFVAMTGAALAAQRARMINMDVVTRLLSPRARAWLRVITALFVVAVCVLLFRGGMDMRDTAMHRNQNYEIISETVGLLALPIGAILIGVHFLLHAVIDFSYLVGGKLPPEPEHQAH